MFGYLTNLDRGAVLISLCLFGVTGWILIVKKNSSLVVFLLISFVLPILMLLIQRVHPFDRVWTYLILPYSLCVLVVINYFHDQISRQSTIATIIISCGIIGYTFYYFYQDTSHGHLIYDEVSQISSTVVRESNGNIYTNEDLYNLYIRYESSRNGKEIIPDMSAKRNDYSHLLLIPGSSFPGSLEKLDYVLVRQNPYIEVYKLK
jgi:hypothetical protein